jgi:hypothetical protein
MRLARLAREGFARSVSCGVIRNFSRSLARVASTTEDLAGSQTAPPHSVDNLKYSLEDVWLGRKSWASLRRPADFIPGECSLFEKRTSGEIKAPVFVAY